MTTKVRQLFVADSRAFSFDQYPRPKSCNLDLDFIIIRGAKIYDLILPTLAKLRTYSKSEFVIIKLAAGINDLTVFTDSPHSRAKVLQKNDLCLDGLFAKFNHFKQQVLGCRATVIVSFVTIPPASFAKFQASKSLPAPILSEAELKFNQQQLDALLDQANTRIRMLNSELQLSVCSRTLSWHTSIRKPSKRRNRAGHYTTLRNDFSQLYDGLHAKSELKRKWFNELLRSFELDTFSLQQQLIVPCC